MTGRAWRTCSSSCSLTCPWLSCPPRPRSLSPLARSSSASRIAAAAPEGGTKITVASAPVAFFASVALAKTGRPRCSLPAWWRGPGASRELRAGGRDEGRGVAAQREESKRAMHSARTARPIVRGAQGVESRPSSRSHRRPSWCRTQSPSWCGRCPDCPSYPGLGTVKGVPLDRISSLR